MLINVNFSVNDVAHLLFICACLLVFSTDCYPMFQCGLSYWLLLIIF